jgi:hypothetical protein
MPPCLLFMECLPLLGVKESGLNDMVREKLILRGEKLLSTVQTDYATHVAVGLLHDGRG